MQSLSLYDHWVYRTPWWILLAAIATLLLVGYYRGRFPTRWAAIPLVLGLLVSIPLSWVPELALVVFFIDCLWIALLAIDYMRLPKSQQLIAFREIPQTASLGSPLHVQIRLENHSATSTFRGQVCDDVPDGFEFHPEEQDFVLPPHKRLTVQYRLTPRQRGFAKLEKVYYRLLSPLRLWQSFSHHPVESGLSVYPDIKQLADYALLARTDRLSLIGVRQTRKIGTDNEFERLRDYSRDDNYRHIDWRSTARRNRLTVRQYQSDQSQRLMIMLDCGRMMTNMHAGYSLLDRAINASLMLAHVALRQGDSVGMLCFSDRVHAYVPPRAGRTQNNRLLHAVYNQFPRLVESRYDEAFLYLSNYCRRRSLVVLITNIIDQVNADQIQNYLGNLAGRHLPLAVVLRDREMFQTADNPATDGAILYRSAAAAEILCWRHQVLTRLRHRGALVVDTFPDELNAPLVNEYLEIKAKHLL